MVVIWYLLQVLILFYRFTAILYRGNVLDVHFGQ